MVIIIMNLLIGLAISSIEELNINGDKTQALKRVRVILAGTRLPSDTAFGWLEKTIGFVPNVNIMKRFSDEKLTTKKVRKFLLMTMPKMITSTFPYRCVSSYPLAI